MYKYSQKDPRWANQRLGTCNGETLAKSGCKITCYAMLDGRTPAEIDNYLTDNKIYVSGCLTVDETCAKALGLEYNGRSTTAPNYPCIAETDHYKGSGVPQHFFIYDPATKKRLDPLDLNPEWETNTYKIVSYRLFKEIINNESMELSKEQKKELEELGLDFGDKVNEGEFDRLLKKALELKKGLSECVRAVNGKNLEVGELEVKLALTQESLSECQNKPEVPQVPETPQNPVEGQNKSLWDVLQEFLSSFKR